MYQRDYEIYCMYLSFERDINNIEKHINEIPMQTSGGHSKIGYMTDELSKLKSDLLKVIEEHKIDIDDRKNKL